jgi:hypothetical protein
MRRSSGIPLASLLVSLVVQSPLQAQTGLDKSVAIDVALGVAMNGPADVNQRPKCTELGLPCLTPRTFPDFGFVAQAGISVLEYAGLVAEASTYNNSWFTTSSDVATINHVGAVLVGPRVTTGTRTLRWYNDTTRFRAFAQVLGGSETSAVLPTRFALQPGAGVDGQLRWSRTWIRVAYDYRFTRGGPRNLSGSRVLFGFALDVTPRSASQ